VTAVPADTGNVLQGAENRGHGFASNCEQRNGEKSLNLVKGLEALAIWKGNGALGQVPHEANVHDRGTKVLAFEGNRMPWNAKWLRDQQDRLQLKMEVGSSWQGVWQRRAEEYKVVYPFQGGSNAVGCKH
jgi:hypothetical protein